MRKRSTITRYILFQTIELLITIIVVYIIWYFFELPLWLAFVVVALAVIKDFVMYFYTWRSYVLPSPNDAALMVGKTCIAAIKFENEGRVLYQGELWKAKLIKQQIVDKGHKLYIHDVDGLQLLVDDQKPI